jgi:hypothetical protein
MSTTSSNNSFQNFTSSSKDSPFTSTWFNSLTFQETIRLTCPSIASKAEVQEWRWDTVTVRNLPVSCKDVIPPLDIIQEILAKMCAAFEISHCAVTIIYGSSAVGPYKIGDLRTITYHFAKVHTS